MRSFRAIDLAILLLGCTLLTACFTTRRPDPPPTPPDGAPQEQACQEGLTRGPHGHCCWPGQSWSQEQARCQGEPACPEGWVAHEQGCARRDAELVRLQGRCAQADPEACQELWRHPAGEGDAQVAAFIQGEVERCRQEGPQSCDAILPWLLDEQGTSYEPDLALGVLEWRCDQSNYEACDQAAQVWWARESWGEAEGAWSRGCQGEHEPSCQGLGRSWSAGFLRGGQVEDWGRLRELADDIQGEGWLEEGSDLLLELYSQACAGNQEQDQEACFRLTELAGERLYQGRAPTLWAMACLGPEHHANAGWAGDPQACLALGQERAPQRPSQAVRLLQRACEGFPGTPGGQGIHEGCVLLVEVNQRLESQGAPPEQSRQRYGLACGQGVARACAEAGRLWRDEGRGDSGDAQAVRLFQEGCDRGDWSACRQLAWMMERGRGVSLNLPGAADLYERACEAGEAAACFGLGKMLRDGRGVEADPREASALMARACQLGWKPACATP